MEKIWNIGVGNDISMYLRGKIRISNFIALILFLLGGIYAFISAYAGSVLFFIPIAASLFACAVFILNYLKTHRLSRFILSVSAVACCSVYHTGIINQPGHVNSALYFAEFGFALFSWVLFDFREKTLPGACTRFF